MLHLEEMGEENFGFESALEGLVEIEADI